MKNKKELVIGFLVLHVGIGFLFQGYYLFFVGSGSDKHPLVYVNNDIDFVPLILILFGILLILGGIVIIDFVFRKWELIRGSGLLSIKKPTRLQLLSQFEIEI